MKKESYTCGNKDKRVNSCVINRRLKKKWKSEVGKSKVKQRIRRGGKEMNRKMKYQIL